MNAPTKATVCTRLTDDARFSSGTLTCAMTVSKDQNQFRKKLPISTSARLKKSEPERYRTAVATAADMPPMKAVLPSSNSLEQIACDEHPRPPSPNPSPKIRSTTAVKLPETPNSVSRNFGVQERYVTKPASASMAPRARTCTLRSLMSDLRFPFAGETEGLPRSSRSTMKKIDKGGHSD